MIEAVDIFYGSMRESSSKVGIFLTEKDHRALRVVYKNVPKLIKQQNLDITIGIGTRRSNFFFQLMQNVMVPAVEGGIPQHFLKYILEVFLHPLEDDPSEPKVFSFSDLSFGFVVWGCACGIFLTVFIIELLWTFSKKKIKEFHAIFHIRRFLGRGFL